MRRSGEGGRKDTPPTHHFSAGGWSRFAVFVRSRFRRGRALPRLASRWQSWFTLSRCLRERRFNLPEIALPLRPRLQRKTRSSRGGSKRGDFGGGKEGCPSSGIEAPANFRRNAPSSVRSQSPDRRLRSCRGTALRWLRPRAGVWGTDHHPVVPAPQRVGKDTPRTLAGAAAQVSVGRAAHHRLPRQGQLPNQRWAERRTAAITPGSF